MASRNGLDRVVLERVVLSALMRGDFTPLEVADGLRPDDFTAGPHRLIAGAIFELLHERWEQRDRVAAVAAGLATRSQLAAAGGEAELAVLAAADVQEAQIREAAEELMRRTDLERLAQAAKRIALAAAGDGDPEKAWLGAEDALFEAIPRTARWERPQSARAMTYCGVVKIERAQEQLRGEQPASATLFPCGLASLDERFGGMAGPELTLILAPHGWARVLALQASLAAAAAAGRRVIYASAEPRPEFVSRAIAWLGRTADPLRARGELKGRALRRMAEGAQQFHGMQLTYVEPPTATRVVRALRAQVDVQQPRLLVIDEVRRLGRGYRSALLRLRQLGRADGSRLLAAMATGPAAAPALDPFFPDGCAGRVAELATRIVHFQPGPPRAGTLRVLDRMLGIELRVRVRLSGPEMRIVEYAAGGASGRGSGRA